jgi:hypothetical protein
MEPRRARMRGVRAPHRRTAHAAHPPIRGCAAGCAVGGANFAATVHRSPARPGRGGPPTAASRDSAAGPHYSLPPAWGCHVIQRERLQTLPGMFQTHTRRPPGPRGRSRPTGAPFPIRRSPSSRSKPHRSD